jgi:hypothetical protein
VHFFVKRFSTRVLKFRFRILCRESTSWNSPTSKNSAMSPLIHDLHNCCHSQGLRFLSTVLGICALNLATSWAQGPFPVPGNPPSAPPDDAAQSASDDLSASAWAEGYPKLHFGSQLLPGGEVFPQRFGSMPSKGGVAQDLILRLKASHNLSDPSFSVALAGFGGGDNSWSLTSTSIACFAVGSDGAISPQDDCFRGQVPAAQWEDVTGTLTINLKHMAAATDYAIIISATSITGGKGPLPPSCLRKDSETAIYISRASSGDQQLPKVRPALIHILQPSLLNTDPPPIFPARCSEAWRRLHR